MNAKYLTSLLLSLSATMAMAQNQELDRQVTVEHEYQPTLSEASKVDRTPTEVSSPQREVADVNYSDYNAPIHVQSQFSPISSEPTRFSKPEPTHGTLEGGLGHPQTMLKFGYHHIINPQNHIHLHIHHHGEWGLKADAHTSVGVDYEHLYKSGKFYAHFDGGNEYFTYYGRYADPEHGEINHHHTHLTSSDKQILWRLNLKAGVESDGKQDLNYKADLALHFLDRLNSVAEYNLEMGANVNYRILNGHLTGINFRLQNYFQNPLGDVQAAYDANPDAHYNSRHCFRIEPYYEWTHTRMRLHAGINLNINIGKGELNSVHTDNLKAQTVFAPSPNIQFEGIILPNYLIGYAKVEGSLGTSSMAGYYELNRYHNAGRSMTSHHPSSYKPVDIEIGFRTRPEKNLSLDIHAGYLYVMNTAAYRMHLGAYDAATVDQHYGYAQFIYTNYQRWKIGGELNYHYRDILELKAAGDWYAYRGIHDDNGNKTPIYDRPKWECSLRIDGHIDRHWTVYTWEEFKGRRLAMIGIRMPDNTEQNAERVLPAFINLNIGTRYQFAQTGNQALDRLSLFLELKNIMHRKNQIWYGYESEGINFLLGAKWTF